MELPVGYRFKPTDEELVFHYLINKACNRALPAQAVKEITARDLYLKHPKCSGSTMRKKNMAKKIPRKQKETLP
ncbi:hypothetical protein CICLE_v10023783mg [Citrus x clementina]|uniref:NAC domain-containing protein n=1 Tax=Citrus clementina TaxID=85681 RepID=V4TKL5_CITCL|nr:hypothetical protein CICLE_v10023783mg [Citrus x clementina]